jgi:hypothetical protein
MSKLLEWCCVDFHVGYLLSSHTMMLFKLRYPINSSIRKGTTYLEHTCRKFIILWMGSPPILHSRYIAQGVLSESQIERNKNTVIDPFHDPAPAEAQVYLNWQNVAIVEFAQASLLHHSVQTMHHMRLGTRRFSIRKFTLKTITRAPIPGSWHRW